MTYRDDRDADQARIAALERELVETRAKLAAIEGKQSLALTLATPGALVPRNGAARWFGPFTLQLARRFDGTFPTDRFEELIDRIREIARDPGRTEILRSSMTWSASAGERSAGAFRVITVTIRDGVTTLTATDRLAGLAGGIYGGLGGGGISLPIMASVAVPVLTPVFVIGWLGGIFLGTRAIYHRAARRRAIALQQLFDALVVDMERAMRM